MFRGNTPKKTIGFAIIGSALAFAAFTIVNAVGSYRVALPENGKANLYELLPSSTEPVALPNTKVMPVPEENVTSSVARTIAAELLAKNPNGPTLDDGAAGVLAGDPELLIEAALAAELDSFDYASFKPEITRNEVVIQTNPDAAAYPSYLREFQRIIRETYAGLSFNPRETSPDMIFEFEAAARASVAKLKALPVPLPLAPLHEEEIRLLSAEAKAFQMLGNTNNDPVGALVAIRAFSSIDADFKTLNEKFKQFFVKEHISL